MAQQNVMLAAKGLFSFPNSLSEVPQGALSTADNIVIDRDGTIEPRRGFNLYGNASGSSPSTDIAKQLFTYKNVLLRHYSNSLQYDSDNAGTFLTFSGTYSEVLSGLRMKGLEANGNFYFTTSDGIKKISALTSADFNTGSGYITSAGGVKALDLQASLNSNEGFFTEESTVAYRIVWGIRDLNTNEILGSPSERVVIYNPLTPILTIDFNNLLSSIDIASAEDVGDILTDTDYLATLRVDPNSSSSALRSGLLALTDKLDNDIIITESTIQTVTASLTSNVAQVVFNSDLSNYLVIGDTVVISALPGGVAPLNGTQVITAITTTTVPNDTIEFSLTHVDIAPVSSTAGIVQRLMYTLIPQPMALNLPPTSQQLISMQTYYDAIVAQLQSEPIGIIAAGAQPVGSTSIQSSTVDLNFTIPQDITTAHFYQVYRTKTKTSQSVSVLQDTDPGDEMGLVYEANPTVQDIINGYIDITDITPDGFIGANLYTNENSGEGILQSNEVPPLAQDITFFKNSVFYANTKTKQRLSLSLLSVPNDAVTQITTINCVAKAQLIDGDYFTISDALNVSNYDVWFNVSGTATPPGLPGRIELEADVSGVTTDSDVADIVAQTLNTSINFSATNLLGVVTCANNKRGASTPAASFVADVGFTISSVTGSGNDSTFIISGSNTYRFVSPTSEATLLAFVPAANLNNGEYFTLNSGGDINQYYFWVDKGGAIDPALPNKTGIRLELTGIETDSQVADKALALINTLNDFISSVVSNVVTVVNAISGECTHSTATVADPNFIVKLQVIGEGEDIVNKLVPLSNLSTVGQRVDAVARSLIRIINRQSSESVYGFYLSGPDDVPGKILLEARTLSTPQFTVISNNSFTGGLFSPNITTIQTSNNEVSPNRMYYSKVQQPEAVPILNYVDIGTKDSPIRRVIHLRDSLFVLKDEGIYRIVADVVPNITVSLFDNSLRIIASDSAAVINNQIYMLSTQGVVRVGDTGVGIVSRPIEDSIIKASTVTNTSTATFGVGYQIDRAYLLFVPTLNSDVQATQCFRFNVLTNTWSRFPIGKTCGVVNDGDNKLYLGASDTNYIEKERKDHNRYDHADRDYSITLSVGSISNNTVHFPTLVNVAVGDALVQTQYLNYFDFNRLLQRLDGDFGLPSHDYFTTLAAGRGSSLSNSLQDLAAKIDAELSIGIYTPLAASASDSNQLGLQSIFNAIVTQLNIQSELYIKNYTISSGVYNFETVIDDINVFTNIVTLQIAIPLIVGPITIFKHIDSIVVWAPQHFGQPAYLKQISEATFIFENTNFTKATASYSSDLDISFDDITFNGIGNGDFGSFTWGTVPWGGVSSQSPLRTLIPRNKQRCRFIKCKFRHMFARESFSIFGLSLLGEISSNRAYR